MKTIQQKGGLLSLLLFMLILGSPGLWAQTDFEQPQKSKKGSTTTEPAPEEKDEIEPELITTPLEEEVEEIKSASSEVPEELATENVEMEVVMSSQEYDDPDEYLVQVAAFGKRKNAKFFKDRGLEGVYEKYELQTFFKYYLGPFENRQAAEVSTAEAIEKGFPFARVINITEVRELCNNSCKTTTPMTSILIYSQDQIIRVRNVFFNFDSSDLKREGRDELNKLAVILRENKNYLVEVHAHTDAKGSNEYNLNLSERRKNTVINYLKYRKVPPFQIESFAHGEEVPIALNEKNGNDSPEGRKFNRRVELKVKDQFKVMDVVEDIVVPEGLRKID